MTHTRDDVDMSKPATRALVVATIKHNNAEIAQSVRALVEPLRARLAALEADTVSLRRALNAATGPGVLRSFTGEWVESPTTPGHVNLMLDDGSHVAASAAGLAALANMRMAGRA